MPMNYNPENTKILPNQNNVNNCKTGIYPPPHFCFTLLNRLFCFSIINLFFPTYFLNIHIWIEKIDNCTNIFFYDNSNSNNLKHESLHKRKKIYGSINRFIANATPGYDCPVSRPEWRKVALLPKVEQRY